MANARADWQTLRGTLAGFVVCVLLSGGLVVASHDFRAERERDYLAHHARFRQASAQYLAVDEEERIIADFYPEFVRLREAGLLGRERRLSWLESLRAAGDDLRLPQLTYRIEAQRPLDAPWPLDLGAYALYASPMNINAGLLHEGDLARLLDALERNARGQYTVRHCTLKRLASEFALDTTAPHVSADCTLDWLTLDLRAGGGLDP